MSVVLGIVSGVSGALLGAWSRTRPPPPLAEAVPRSKIGELVPGRFAVVGRVVPIETEASSIDEARCVYVERVEVVSGGLLRALDHAIVAHRFYLEDETGRIEVDPAQTLVEVSIVQSESGRIAERRVRAGEEIELVCEIRSGLGEGDRRLAAYRAGADGVAVDYGAGGSPAILRDSIDTHGLDLEARPLSRMAAGAAGAALSVWGLVVVLWSIALP